MDLAHCLYFCCCKIISWYIFNLFWGIVCFVLWYAAKSAFFKFKKQNSRSLRTSCTSPVRPPACVKNLDHPCCLVNHQRTHQTHILKLRSRPDYLWSVLTLQYIFESTSCWPLYLVDLWSCKKIEENKRGFSLLEFHRQLLLLSYWKVNHRPTDSLPIFHLCFPLSPLVLYFVFFFW